MLFKETNRGMYREDREGTVMAASKT